MKLTIQFASVFLAAAGLAFSESPLERAQLDAQRRAANAKASYLRDAEAARQQYAICRTNSYYPGAPPMTCQEQLNVAAYSEGMAAAVTATGEVPEATQRQLNDQRKDANQKTYYLRTAFLARQHYDSCMRQPNASANACQSDLNSVREYEALAATYPQPLPK